MAKSKKIKLSALQVNAENYRFEPVIGQKEAIDKMIEDQGDKLFYLAQHILDHGLNPNDRVQVTVSNHDNSKFNVLEGNRRVITLKLLNHPDIIDKLEYLALKKKFRKLHDANKSRLIKEIECTVYDDPAEADKWIKLKHAGQSEGVGTVAWNGQQVQRFEERVEGKSSVALQVLKALKNSFVVPADVKDNLSNLPITNLHRLLADPIVRDFLCIEINNGIIQSEIEEKEVLKGLIQVARDLLKSDFNVKKIYTKEDRKDYLKEFPKSSKPNSNKKAPQPWQLIGTSTTPTPKPKPKPYPSERSTLIPKSCAMQIKNPKVNTIYYELQRLKIDNFTNAVAVLFRVFVELSMDCYIEENKLTTATIDSSLLKKITEVANNMEINKFADKYICKGIRSSANNENDLLGIKTWHAYVHNPSFSPTANNMIITWNNIQPFIQKVWENIK